MRSLAYQIWAVPIIYVFWPEKAKKNSQIIDTDGFNTNTNYTETSINHEDIPDNS